MNVAQPVAGGAKLHIRRGFTLIELLVVVAIIAVLMAILLPSLSAARENAKTVACSVNLRSIGMATRMYADMNNNSLPYNTNAGNTQQWWSLLQDVVNVGQPEVTNANTANPVLSKMYTCPASMLRPTGTYAGKALTRTYAPHPNIFKNGSPSYKRQWLEPRGNEVVIVADTGQKTNGAASTETSFYSMVTTSAAFSQSDADNNNPINLGLYGGQDADNTGAGMASFRWRHRGVGDRAVVNVLMGDFSVGSFWYNPPFASAQTNLLNRNLRYDRYW